MARGIKGRHWVDWDCWALRRSLSSQISLRRSHLRSPLLMPIRWHHHPSSAGTTQFTKHQIHAPENSPSEGACPLILSPGVTLDALVSSSICLLTWWSLLTIDSCGNYSTPKVGVGGVFFKSILSKYIEGNVQVTKQPYQSSQGWCLALSAIPLHLPVIPSRAIPNYTIPYYTISQRYCMPLSACRTYILPPNISHCFLLPPVVLFDLTTSWEATFWHDLIVLPISNGSAVIALTFMNLIWSRKIHSTKFLWVTPKKSTMCPQCAPHPSNNHKQHIFFWTLAKVSK